MTMMPVEQNPGGGLFGFSQGGGMNNLVSNPLFMAGLGLLSAGQDRRINPFQAGAQGLLMANQMQNSQADADMRRQQFGMQQKKFDYEQQKQQQTQELQQKVRGLLESGDQEGAARLAISSGEPSLVQWGGSQLTPKVPAEVQTFEYLQKHPEIKEAYQNYKQMGMRDPNPYYSQVQTPDGSCFVNARNPRDVIAATNPVTGRPLIPYSVDPNAQANVAGAKSGAEATAKEEATRDQNFINSGITAYDGLNDISRMKELNTAMMHGGIAAAATRAGDLFGKTPADEGEFRTLSRQLVLNNIKALGTGNSITDTDRQFIEQMMPYLGQGGEVNDRILNRLEQINRRAVYRGQEAAKRRNQDWNSLIGTPTNLPPSSSKQPSAPGAKFLGFE